MTIVGFEKTANGRVEEYLPLNTQLSGTKEKRTMFMHMFNAYVDEELRFTREEISNGENLHEIFQHKIEKMLFYPCVLKIQATQHIVSIACVPSSSINIFVQRGHKRRPINPNVSLMQVAKLIDLVYNHHECKLLCDMDDMFLHLVYERTKLVNKTKKVLLYDKNILIQDERKDVSPTLLIPAYTHIDKKNLHYQPIVRHHMKTVLSTLKETQVRQIFLVYPKHPEFKKHVSIKLLDKIPLCEDEYRVKVIPYSFSFCIEKQKTTTTLTRRQKCQ